MEAVVRNATVKVIQTPVIPSQDTVSIASIILLVPDVKNVSQVIMETLYSEVNLELANLVHVLLLTITTLLSVLFLSSLSRKLQTLIKMNTFVLLVKLVTTETSVKFVPMVTSEIQLL